MKKSTTLMMAVTLVTLAAGLVIAEINVPEKVTFTPRFGTVTFNHAEHLSVGDCISCHHTGDYVSCSSCHGSQPGISNAKDAFHANCIDCHKEAEQGPIGCRACHVN